MIWKVKFLAQCELFLPMFLSKADCTQFNKKSEVVELVEAVVGTNTTETSVLINASGIKHPMSCRCYPDSKTMMTLITEIYR